MSPNAQPNFAGGELLLIALAIFAAVIVGLAALIFVITRAAHRPPPARSPMPPELAFVNQQRRDKEHVKLLAIFHFVFSGLLFLGICFLGVHYLIMHSISSSPEMWRTPLQGPSPKVVFQSITLFYFFMGFVLLTGLVLNVLSGLFLMQKRNRLFSLIVGGLDCLQIPFGTTLGVLTMLVLSRDSVRQLYDENGPDVNSTIPGR